MVPILLRSPDRPEVRIVTTMERPSGLKTTDFSAIPAADADLISVKVYGFEKPAVRPQRIC